MSVDKLVRADRSLIYPAFAVRMERVLLACEARGAVLFWTSGFRSCEESDRLNALWKAGKGGRAAPGGMSAHNFGIGGDCTHDSDGNALNGLQPDWNSAHYDTYREECLTAGLAHGRDYGDDPHANLMDFTSAPQLAPLYVIWKQSTGSDLDRLKKVWSWLDSKGYARC